MVDATGLGNARSCRRPRRRQLSRFPKPPHGLRIVLRDACAVGVHDPEVVLRESGTLVRRQPIPPQRFRIVLRDAFAVAVPGPEVVLRDGITGLSSHPQRIDLRRLRLHRRIGLLGFETDLRRFDSHDTFNSTSAARTATAANRVACVMRVSQFTTM